MVMGVDGVDDQQRSLPSQASEASGQALKQGGSRGKP